MHAFCLVAHINTDCNTFIIINRSIVISISHAPTTNISQSQTANNSGNRNRPPPLTSSSDIRSNGTALQQQSNRNKCISPTTNANSKAILYKSTQSLLQRQYKGCFITNKSITVGNNKVPIGTAGKVVLSRKKEGEYCCVFAAPYNNIEVIVNPATYLDFGM